MLFFYFFGHNSAPSSPIYMISSGFFPTSLPELFKHSRTSKTLGKNMLLRDEQIDRSEKNTPSHKDPKQQELRILLRPRLIKDPIEGFFEGLVTIKHPKNVNK